MRAAVHLNAERTGGMRRIPSRRRSRAIVLRLMRNRFSKVRSERTPSRMRSFLECAFRTVRPARSLDAALNRLRSLRPDICMGGIVPWGRHAGEAIQKGRPIYSARLRRSYFLISSFRVLHSSFSGRNACSMASRPTSASVSLRRSLTMRNSSDFNSRCMTRSSVLERIIHRPAIVAAIGDAGMTEQAACLNSGRCFRVVPTAA